MSEALRCWRCGADTGLAPPIGRTEECRSCRTQLHVCRMCVHFSRGLPRQCAEQDAEEVREKTRANFCDWFRPSTSAYTGEFDGPEARARDELRALFGETTEVLSPSSDSPAEAFFDSPGARKPSAD
ncbi:MAG: hypothetical protein JJT85_01760 [Chromatiales bacterium]|nr:hypothetical protein [Chromatiales bacterium]